MARLTWSMRRGGRRIGVVGIVLGLGVAAGCTDGGARWNTPGGPGSPAAAPGATLTISHAAEEKDRSPADPVTVTVADGTLDSVVLTAAGGGAVAGELNASATSWRSTGDLDWGTTYTLTASGRGLDGRTYAETRTFTTVNPGKGNFIVAGLSFFNGVKYDGATFGVAIPVFVNFDEDVARKEDRAEVERSLRITTDPPGIVGAWYWETNRRVVFRPKAYWPSGTKVTVVANLYGKKIGAFYGDKPVSASFRIGPKRYAVADHDTHRMKVYIDDKQVTTINGRDVTIGIPISMGKGGTVQGDYGPVSFETQSGPHIIMSKHEQYRMRSSTFGLSDPNSGAYDEVIKKSMRISYDGEFVHLADWNIGAHGKRNTSHGCVNVGPTYIYWFYNTFVAGDVVDVTRTSVKLPIAKGGYWGASWSRWLTGSATGEVVTAARQG